MNEARPLLEADAVVAQIAADLENFRDGVGPDKEADNVALGQRYGLNVAAIEAQWSEARRQRQTESQSFFAQPSFQDRREPPIDLDAPFAVAQHFVVSRHSTKIANKIIPTLRWWNAEWRIWTGTHYAVMEGDALRSEIYGFLAKANGGRLNPAQHHVNKIIDAIQSVVFLPAEVEAGTWLGDDKCWSDEPFICCKNGVLRLSDGRLLPHDPRLFTLNAIDTEYRADAPAPRWMQFLDELWDDDHETRDALQEFFGLTLTDETKFQKGFIIVGPARSGKGTIARMLMHLLGRSNYCGPSLNQLAQSFGMQGLIGKKLAVVPDARLDNRANRSVITEKLLSIIGEDVQDINRKNKPYWSGILRLRILILSNELPDFKDDTGVIATRFIILQTLNSYLGREDTELEAKLRGELSGILNWALAGWHRLAQRGRFIPPRGDELNEELSNNASAVKAFVAERCEFGDGYSVSIEATYNAYRVWCEGSGARGWADRLPINQFSHKMRSAFPGQINVIRPRDGGTRKRVFVGLRLRKPGT